jgi:hypothetical protein
MKEKIMKIVEYKKIINLNSNSNNNNNKIILKNKIIIFNSKMKMFKGLD